MATNQDSWRPLFVGSIVGGSTGKNESIRAALSRLAQIVDGLIWESRDDETGVDAVFHVAGPLLAPEYSGIRTGKFSKAEKMIVIQIAVPTALEGIPEGQVIKILAEALAEATEIAKVAVGRRKGTSPVSQAVRLAQLALQSIDE